MPEERKEILERITKKFMSLDDPDIKGYAVIDMTAYLAGKEAGKTEERERWIRKNAVIA